MTTANDEKDSPGKNLREDGRLIAVIFEQIIEVHDPEPHSAALNMALDEALLPRATQPTLRLYRWRAPALSLGYFSRFAEAQRLAAGREMVRRWTGGGLVEHGDDVTYTLIVPRESALWQHPPLESYRLIHEQIAQWLRERGIAAAVADSSAEVNSHACFAAHVRHDIIQGATKIAGAAQRRTRWGLLHQGSIRASLPDAAGFAASFAQRIQPAEITPELLQAAQEIARQKYATDAWLQKFQHVAT